MGTHCLDLIRWLMVPWCGEVTEIHGVISRSVWEGPHDETAIVTLKLASGATAEFLSSVQFESPSRVEVYGGRGHVIGTDTMGPHGTGSISTHDGELAFEVVNPYVGELEDFAAAIRGGRAPEVDGVEGLRNVELLERVGGANEG